MIYYLFFAFTSFLSSLAGKNKLLFVLLIIILVLFAGTRINVDNDYFMYKDQILYVEDTLKAFMDRSIPLEYCMYVIPNFLEYFFYDKSEIVNSTFLIFAFLGVTTKLLAIKKYSEIFFLSVLLYLGNLFMMQEMTTIRAGVAAGIFLLALDNLEKKEHKQFFFKILLCFFFHSSSVLFVLAWFLLQFKINIKYYYFGIVVSFIFVALKVNILTLLMLDRVFPRVKAYLDAMEWMVEDKANVFNFRGLFALFIIILFAFHYKKLKNIKYFDVLFKIHIFSLCLFYVFSTTAQVFSIRTFEMFSVAHLLLYPMLIHIFHPKLKLVGWAIIILFSFIQIYYMVDVAGIYKPYQSWLF